MLIILKIFTLITFNEMIIFLRGWFILDWLSWIFFKKINTQANLDRITQRANIPLTNVVIY